MDKKGGLSWDYWDSLE